MNQKTKALKDYNDELDQQIADENQEAFTNMICYLRGANISQYHQELVRRDLTEMVLSAQGRGESIQDVIGGEYKEFCDDVITNLPPRTKKETIVDFFDIISSALSILVAINIVVADGTPEFIHGLVTGGPQDFSISFSVGSVVSMAAILIAAVVIVEVIMKQAFVKSKDTGYKKTKGFLFGAGLMGIVLLITWFGRTPLFSVNIFLACAFALALYAAHKLLERI